MARYLVTGGAGFIGSNLVDLLLERGHEVVAFDSLLSGHERNLAHLKANTAFSFIKGDILERDELAAAMKGCDAVFHQAALGSVAGSVERPELTNEINVSGSINVFQEAREAGIRRLVLASSSSVYGDTPELPKHERMRLEPISPYAASKAAMEHYALAWSECFDLEIVCLRYFNVYGPRQDPRSRYAAVVPAFACRLLGGETPTIDGSGEQSRDFTYVGDVALANLQAATQPWERLKSRVYNIAGGVRISMNRLYGIIAELTGHAGVKPGHGPRRPGDVDHTLADVSLAAEELEWRPGLVLEEGLARTVEWFGAHPEQGR